MKVSIGYICPHDQSAVACVGEHTDAELVGRCQYCKRVHRLANTHPDRPSRHEERIAELEAEIARRNADPDPEPETSPETVVEEPEPEPEHADPDPDPEPEHHDDGAS